MIIITDIENTLNKIQHLFMMKNSEQKRYRKNLPAESLRKPEITFLNIIKAIYNNTQSQHHVKW